MDSNEDTETAARTTEKSPNVVNTTQSIVEATIRNVELKEVHKRKELELEMLVQKNALLEQEVKRKEIIRLSQLELLALRNVELEKQIAHVKSNAATRN
jgi:hypothetical protein